MLSSFKDQSVPNARHQPPGTLSQGGLLAATGFLPSLVSAAPVDKSAKNLYEAIGVRPIINARGTFTIISGSQSLPEVKTAMLEASKHYVHMDELMEAVSTRLAEITKADWGIVTAGCAAALTHATAACIAGGTRKRCSGSRISTGLKDEVIMPRYSRNQYDHAVRMLGVKIIEVDTGSATRNGV